MKNIAKIALAATLLLAIGSTAASADADKGQKYFTKKLKSPCGISGAALAGKHTQAEWQAIGKDGVAAELQKICPKAPAGAFKDTYLEHYYDFVFTYGSDSGNIPAC